MSSRRSKRTKESDISKVKIEPEDGSVSVRVKQEDLMKLRRKTVSVQLEKLSESSLRLHEGGKRRTSDRQIHSTAPLLHKELQRRSKNIQGHSSGSLGVSEGQSEGQIGIEVDHYKNRDKSFTSASTVKVVRSLNEETETGRQVYALWSEGTGVTGLTQPPPTGLTPTRRPALTPPPLTAGVEGTLLQPKPVVIQPIQDEPERMEFEDGIVLEMNEAEFQGPEESGSDGAFDDSDDDTVRNSQQSFDSSFGSQEVTTLFENALAEARRTRDNDSLLSSQESGVSLGSDVTDFMDGRLSQPPNNTDAVKSEKDGPTLDGDQASYPSDQSQFFGMFGLVKKSEVPREDPDKSKLHREVGGKLRRVVKRKVFKLGRPFGSRTQKPDGEGKTKRKGGRRKKWRDPDMPALSKQSDMVYNRKEEKSVAAGNSGRPTIYAAMAKMPALTSLVKLQSLAKPASTATAASQAKPEEGEAKVDIDLSTTESTEASKDKVQLTKMLLSMPQQKLLSNSPKRLADRYKKNLEANLSLISGCDVVIQDHNTGLRYKKPRSKNQLTRDLSFRPLGSPTPPAPPPAIPTPPSAPEGPKPRRKPYKKPTKRRRKKGCSKLVSKKQRSMYNSRYYYNQKDKKPTQEEEDNIVIKQEVPGEAISVKYEPHLEGYTLTQEEEAELDSQQSANQLSDTSSRRPVRTTRGKRKEWKHLLKCNPDIYEKMTKLEQEQIYFSSRVNKGRTVRLDPSYSVKLEESTEDETQPMAASRRNALARKKYKDKSRDVYAMFDTATSSQSYLDVYEEVMESEGGPRIKNRKKDWALAKQMYDDEMERKMNRAKGRDQPKRGRDQALIDLEDSQDSIDVVEPSPPRPSRNSMSLPLRWTRHLEKQGFYVGSSRDLLGEVTIKTEGSDSEYRPYPDRIRPRGVPLDILDQIKFIGMDDTPIITDEPEFVTEPDSFMQIIQQRKARDMRVEDQALHSPMNHRVPVIGTDGYTMKDTSCLIPHMCSVCWVNDHMYCKNMKRTSKDLDPHGGCLHYVPCKHYTREAILEAEQEEEMKVFRRPLIAIRAAPTIRLETNPEMEDDEIDILGEDDWGVESQEKELDCEEKMYSSDDEVQKIPEEHPEEGTELLMAQISARRRQIKSSLGLQEDDSLPKFTDSYAGGDNNATSSSNKDVDDNRGQILWSTHAAEIIVASENTWYYPPKHLNMLLDNKPRSVSVYQGRATTPWPPTDGDCRSIAKTRVQIKVLPPVATLKSVNEQLMELRAKTNVMKVRVHKMGEDKIVIQQILGEEKETVVKETVVNVDDHLIRDLQANGRVDHKVYREKGARLGNTILGDVIAREALRLVQQPRPIPVRQNLCMKVGCDTATIIVKDVLPDDVNLVINEASKQRRKVICKKDEEVRPIVQEKGVNLYGFPQVSWEIVKDTMSASEAVEQITSVVKANINKFYGNEKLLKDSDRHPFVPHPMQVSQKSTVVSSVSQSLLRPLHPFKPAQWLLQQQGAMRGPDVVVDRAEAGPGGAPMPVHLRFANLTKDGVSVIKYKANQAPGTVFSQAPGTIFSQAPGNTVFTQAPGNAVFTQAPGTVFTQAPGTVFSQASGNAVFTQAPGIVNTQAPAVLPPAPGPVFSVSGLPLAPLPLRLLGAQTADLVTPSTADKAPAFRVKIKEPSPSDTTEKAAEAKVLASKPKEVQNLTLFPLTAGEDHIQSDQILFNGDKVDVKHIKTRDIHDILLQTRAALVDMFYLDVPRAAACQATNTGGVFTKMDEGMDEVELMFSDGRGSALSPVELSPSPTPQGPSPTPGDEAQTQTPGKEEGGRTTPGMEVKTGRTTPEDLVSQDKQSPTQETEGKPAVKTKSLTPADDHKPQQDSSKTGSVADEKQVEVELVENTDSNQSSKQSSKQDTPEASNDMTDTVNGMDLGTEKSKSFTDSFSQFLAEGKSAEPTRQDDQTSPAPSGEEPIKVPSCVPITQDHTPGARSRSGSAASDSGEKSDSGASRPGGVNSQTLTFTTKDIREKRPELIEYIKKACLAPVITTKLNSERHSLENVLLKVDSLFMKLKAELEQKQCLLYAVRSERDLLEDKLRKLRTSANTAVNLSEKVHTHLQNLEKSKKKLDSSHKGVKRTWQKVWDSLSQRSSLKLNDSLNLNKPLHERVLSEQPGWKTTWIKPVSVKVLESEPITLQPVLEIKPDDSSKLQSSRATDPTGPGTRDSTGAKPRKIADILAHVQREKNDSSKLQASRPTDPTEPGPQGSVSVGAKPTKPSDLPAHVQREKKENLARYMAEPNAKQIALAHGERVEPDICEPMMITEDKFPQAVETSANQEVGSAEVLSNYFSKQFKNSFNKSGPKISLPGETHSRRFKSYLQGDSLDKQTAHAKIHKVLEALKAKLIKPKTAQTMLSMLTAKPDPNCALCKMLASVNADMLTPESVDLMKTQLSKRSCDLCKPLVKEPDLLTSFCHLQTDIIKPLKPGQSSGQGSPVEGQSTAGERDSVVTSQGHGTRSRGHTVVPGLAVTEISPPGASSVSLLSTNVKQKISAQKRKSDESQVGVDQLPNKVVILTPTSQKTVLISDDKTDGVKGVLWDTDGKSFPVLTQGTRPQPGASLLTKGTRLKRKKPESVTEEKQITTEPPAKSAKKSAKSTKKSPKKESSVAREGPVDVVGEGGEAGVRTRRQRGKPGGDTQEAGPPSKGKATKGQTTKNKVKGQAPKSEGKGQVSKTEVKGQASKTTTGSKSDKSNKSNGARSSSIADSGSTVVDPSGSKMVDLSLNQDGRSSTTKTLGNSTILKKSSEAIGSSNTVFRTGEKSTMSPSGVIFVDSIPPPFTGLVPQKFKIPKNEIDFSPAMKFMIPTPVKVSGVISPVTQSNAVSPATKASQSVIKSNQSTRSIISPPTVSTAQQSVRGVITPPLTVSPSGVIFGDSILDPFTGLVPQKFKVPKIRSFTELDFTKIPTPCVIPTPVSGVIGPVSQSGASQSVIKSNQSTRSIISHATVSVATAPQSVQGVITPVAGPTHRPNMVGLLTPVTIPGQSVSTSSQSVSGVTAPGQGNKDWSALTYDQLQCILDQSDISDSAVKQFMLP